jgi:hypothetical protein
MFTKPIAKLKTIAFSPSKAGYGWDGAMIGHLGQGRQGKTGFLCPSEMLKRTMYKIMYVP